jgi:hypothetical protein
VARRDYRLAAQLRDTIDVLTPRPGGPLTLADCAPAGPGEALRCFWANGFASHGRYTAIITRPCMFYTGNH